MITSKQTFKPIEPYKELEVYHTTDRFEDKYKLLFMDKDNNQIVLKLDTLKSILRTARRNLKEFVMR